MARRLELHGYAHNLDNGDVEVLACGEASAVDELEAWLWKGPANAAVSRVEAREQPYEERHGFTTG